MLLDAWQSPGYLEWVRPKASPEQLRALNLDLCRRVVQANSLMLSSYQPLLDACAATY